MIYPRIRFGVSVQIKTKREPEISFYFIKVNFCRDLDRKMRAELVGPNVDKKRVHRKKLLVGVGVRQNLLFRIGKEIPYFVQYNV